MKKELSVYNQLRHVIRLFCIGILLITASCATYTGVDEWKQCMNNNGTVIDTNYKALSNNVYLIAFRMHKATDDDNQYGYNYYKYECDTKYLNFDKSFGSNAVNKLTYNNVSTSKTIRSWKIETDINCDEAVAYNLCRYYIGDSDKPVKAKQ